MMEMRPCTSAQMEKKKKKREEKRLVIVYGRGANFRQSHVLRDSMPQIFLVGQCGLAETIEMGICCSLVQMKRKTKIVALAVEVRGGGGDGDGGGSIIPLDLLYHIAERLDFFPDLASFASVCLRWRSVGLEMVRSRNWIRQAPLLMLLESDWCLSRFGFFSLSHGSSFELQFQMEMMRHRVCIGASYGWLVLADNEDFLASDVKLFNPFTMECISLPPLKSVHSLIEATYNIHFTLGVNKVAFSCDPADHLSGSSCSSFVVVMILEHSFLVFCRPGDLCWTLVYKPNGLLSNYGDVIYSHGLFYVIYGHRVASLDVCKDKADDGSTRIVLLSLPKLWQDAPCPGINYLVSCSGELMSIHCRIENLDRYTKTTRMLVFQLDYQRGEWVEAHGIGENTIFIGKNQSVSLSLRDCPGWRANCVYFTQTNYRYSDQFPDMGIFDFNERKIYPVPMDELPWPKQPIWVIQNDDGSNYNL